jgi:GTP cyclohydrolase I
MIEITEEQEATLGDGPVLSHECKTIVANSVLNILCAVGEDPSREGLRNTPTRVARSYDELLAGYNIEPEKLLNNALFDVEYSEMVIVSDIDFYSMCEHHMLPIIGKAHVAYLPDKKVIGLSKIPRIVEAYARRLQVQERMTQQIAHLIDELVQPLGVAVIVDGMHLCVAMRGAKKSNARMRTSALTGLFLKSEKTRMEFMEHVGSFHRT